MANQETVPRFTSREEYERWKAERLAAGTASLSPNDTRGTLHNEIRSQSSWHNPLVKVLGLALAVSAGLLAFKFAHSISKDYFEWFFGSTSLRTASDRMNASLPRLIDKDTELTSTKVVDQILIYNYRLVNSFSNQIDPEKFRQAIRSRVVLGDCSDSSTAKDLQKGVTLRYVYSDTAGTLVTSFDVTAADCTPQ